jgi:hypothetical protein
MKKKTAQRQIKQAKPVLAQPLATFIIRKTIQTEVFFFVLSIAALKDGVMSSLARCS